MNPINIQIIQSVEPDDGATTPNVIYVASCFMPNGGNLSTYGSTIGQALELLGQKIEDNLT
jgi:hypothetical protein